MATEFKLPDLGEGVKAAEVVKVLVAVGDQVALDQPVIEVETDKAGLEVPATVAGKVTEVRVAAGDQVKVGAVVLVIDETAAGVTAPPPPPAAEPAAPAEAPPEPAVPAAPPAPAPVPEQPLKPAPAAGDPVFASPSVRSFAREIGVDIRQVVGSGPGGRIDLDDVKQFARQAPRATGAPASLVELPDFSRQGEVTRERMNNIRRATAAHMATCWATIPHVTIFDKADVTDLEALRNRYKGKAEAAGGKLTITAMMLKLVASALRAHPVLNASLDVERNEVVHKSFVNVGVAADTPKGLVVPVVRDADRKNMVQLAVELTELSSKARAGKLTPDEMSGGTFTVTNLGGIGIGFFTPIVNFPEVGILGLGRAVMEPVWQDGQWVPRLMMPLSLSFDHRLVDGADGARFVRWIIDAIEQPLLLALEG